VSIGRGVIIFVFIFLFSPVISSYFEAPSAYRLLVLTSFIPLIRGFINPSIVKFQKYLEFNKKFYFESILFLFETSVAIAVAYITRSETAIIWGMLSSACLEVVASFAMISPKPKFKFDRQNFMEVINRGKWLTSAGVLDYIFTHLDDLVVARFLGTFTLGLYQNAYKIATLIVLETERIFNSVTLPVYSTISDNKTRLKRAFISTTLAVSFIFIPTGLVIMAFSQQIILIILGSAWLGAVPVLRVLVVYSIIKALTNSTYSLFLSLKMQKVVTTISFVTALGLVITVLPLVARYGMVGAAYSTIIGALVAVPLLLYYLRIVFSGK
jgi:O-antigen/teichoic acid export membrane protein